MCIDKNSHSKTNYYKNLNGKIYLFCGTSLNIKLVIQFLIVYAAGFQIFTMLQKEK